MRTLEVFSKLRESLQRADADDRNSEVSFARRVHSGAKLSAAEEKQLQDAVRVGQVSLERIEQLIAVFERFDALSARAAAADRRLHDRKIEFGDPAAELDSIERVRY